ncbi:MAG: nucleoside hydrolase [Chloroflexi bacterium]|nr:nucleoside hydrolase [Chloroflexota bacterium]
MPRIIIDTDPGVDDAIAILMALAAPSVEVVGCTVVGGNVSHARALRNARALLEFVGRPEIPVHRGSSRPLHGKFASARNFHSGSGLTRRLPEPSVKLPSQGAVDFLAGQLSENPGETTLVAIGPLTNLARLERQYPGSLARAASLVIMGGAVDSSGNIMPQAEFNFYCDPLAAHEVMAVGLPVTLVDLAACRQVAMSREMAFSLKSRTPLGRLALQIIQNWFKVDEQRENMLFYDQIAMAATICPDVMTTRQVSLDIEVEGPEAGVSKVTAGGGPAALADEVDAERLFTLTSQWLGWDAA